MLPYYKNGTNVGIPESHARKDGSQFEGDKRRHKNQLRRNVGQDGSQPRKDDGQDGLPARENRGLSRKYGGHRFGGESRRNKNPRWCMRRSLRKRLP
jgi:hypothetical protein